MISNYLKTLALSTLIISSVFQLPNAHAGIGIYFSSKATTVAGGLTAAAGVAYAVTAGKIPSIYLSVAAIGAAPALVVSGLVILENEQGEIKFKRLSSSEALKLDISEKDRFAFNSEVEILNAIQDDITGELADQENVTVEQTSNMWKERMFTVSPEAFKVAAIITANLLK